MNNPPSLLRMVDWARWFAAEVLVPGDLAVDLTAGTGRDTLHLYRCVGQQGRVLAFDIQEPALQQSASRLAAAGATVDFWNAPPAVGPIPSGIHLIHASHACLASYLRGAPRAIVANLGYLPGGDRSVITDAESTLTALTQALVLLAPGGRLTVTLYIGHPGGREEAVQVEALFRSLEPDRWNVLCLQVSNRLDAPYLLVAEKSPVGASSRITVD